MQLVFFLTIRVESFLVPLPLQICLEHVKAARSILNSLNMWSVSSLVQAASEKAVMRRSIGKADGVGQLGRQMVASRRLFFGS